MTDNLKGMARMRLFASGAALIVAARLAYGQNATKVEFDVASLKPSGPRSTRMVNEDPVMYSNSRATLWDLLSDAWNLVDDNQISGPAWLRQDSFDLAAHFPEGTTEDEFRAMLQNLLIERFKLVVHMETHDLPVYMLVIGKSGLKLRESGTAPAALVPKGDDCFPPLREGVPDIALQFLVGERRCLAAHQEPIAMLVDMLRSSLDRPLIDRTGLTGKYDVALEFSDELSDQSLAHQPPDIFTAIQQLGLRLESSKAPYEVLIVDHAESTPLAN
jgi:uncharacterized protein (TIGR03435 family)